MLVILLQEEYFMMCDLRLDILTELLLDFT